ncbi:MAG: DUF262 domain-containing protein [Bacteroidaceae bacterium]|nr:DUF262 domain-containing protein [Bacteroidaceae bacterium]
MTQEIIPERQSIQSCLSKKTYYVDFYQREYIWNKNTVEVLLRDIFYAFEISYEDHKDEDLTEEVLEQYNWYYMNVFITNKVNSKVYIVDGQQRLTTLTLIATKLYHLITDDTLRDLLKDCIFTKDMFKGNVFCIDNEKRKNVMESILDNKNYEDTFKNKTEETLIARFKDISHFIDEKQMDDNKLRAFCMYFLRKLVMVELSVEKDDTPMVFEVINDRGEALKPFEILKGKMVGLLSKNDTQSFSEKWDKAMLQVQDMQDAFFGDYLKSRFVTSSNTKLEASLSNLYHRYIFDVNDIAQQLSFRRTDTNHIKNIKNFIDNELTYYTSLYAKIRSNKDEYLKYDNEINDLSMQYQSILAACSIDDPKEDEKIHTLAVEMDRFWMLLNLNGVYDSNEFQDKCYRITQQLKDVELESYRTIFDAKLRETIRQKRGIEGDVNLLDYNSFAKKNYTNMNTRMLRYFLARIEKYISNETSISMQDNVMEISRKTGRITGYHIEHILSHNETNRSYFQSDEEFEEKRNQLGGLLLLRGADNISSGNEEYEDKLKTYSNGLMWGHSLCEDFYHSNLSFTNFNDKFKKEYGVSFRAYNVFDKEALEERSRLLYQLVKIIWEVD